MAEQTAAQQSLAGVPAPAEKKTRAEQTRIHDRELKAVERIMRELNSLVDDADEYDAPIRVVRYLADRWGLILVDKDAE